MGLGLSRKPTATALPGTLPEKRKAMCRTQLVPADAIANIIPCLLLDHTAPDFFLHVFLFHVIFLGPETRVGLHYRNAEEFGCRGGVHRLGYGIHG